MYYARYYMVVDLNSATPRYTVPAFQGDSAKELHIRLRCGSNPYVAGAGSTATLSYSSGNVSGIINATLGINADEQEWIVNIGNICENKGMYECQLIVSDAHSQVSTGKFRVRVGDDAVDPVELVSRQDLTALYNAIAMANTSGITYETYQDPEHPGYGQIIRITITDKYGVTSMFDFNLGGKIAKYFEDHADELRGEKGDKGDTFTYEDLSSEDKYDMTGRIPYALITNEDRDYDPYGDDNNKEYGNGCVFEVSSRKSYTIVCEEYQASDENALSTVVFYKVNGSSDYIEVRGNGDCWNNQQATQVTGWHPTWRINSDGYREITLDAFEFESHSMTLDMIEISRKMRVITKTRYTASEAYEKIVAPLEGRMNTFEQVINSNEAGRVAFESQRVIAETGRVNAENSRVSAESARASAESSRVSAESSRVTAESNRTSAESSRVSAENSRTSAESSRASAESARASAEASRVAAEVARQATVDTLNESYADLASASSSDIGKALSPKTVTGGKVTEWQYKTIPTGSGSGSGPVVEVAQIQTTGTKIAEISVDGNPKEIYIPSDLAKTSDIPTSDINANTSARHTHSNKTYLDALTDDHIREVASDVVPTDDITANTDARHAHTNKTYLDGLTDEHINSLIDTKLGSFEGGGSGGESDFELIKTINVSETVTQVDTGLKMSDYKELVIFFNNPVATFNNGALYLMNVANSYFSMDYLCNSSYALYGIVRIKNDGLITVSIASGQNASVCYYDRISVSNKPPYSGNNTILLKGDGRPYIMEGCTFTIYGRS